MIEVLQKMSLSTLIVRGYRSELDDVLQLPMPSLEIT